MRTKGKGSLQIYSHWQTNRCTFPASTGFAHFSRDLSHAQNLILFHGFLFCDIFTSGKYFQLFAIIKDSVQWQIFQVLNWGFLLFWREISFSFFSFLRHIFPKWRFFLFFYLFPSLYLNRRELRLQRLHLWCDNLQDVRQQSDNITFPLCLTKILGLCCWTLSGWWAGFTLVISQNNNSQQITII